jgi:hypothetical protein
MNSRASARGDEYPDSQKEVEELDDVADREELRKRYEVLLQELRVSLPGVQVLSAFLLTAPFSQRFDQLDEWGRRAYGVALISSMLSVICLVGPILLHRLGERRARAARLHWGIRLQVLGMAFLAVALMTAVWGVARSPGSPSTPPPRGGWSLLWSPSSFSSGWPSRCRCVDDERRRPAR